MLSLWNHARGAYFKSYKDFFKWHTWSGLEGSVKPEGWAIKIVSESYLWRKALDTSSCRIGHWFVVAIARIVLMVVALITWLNVSL